MHSLELSIAALSSDTSQKTHDYLKCHTLILMKNKYLLMKCGLSGTASKA